MRQIRYIFIVLFTGLASSVFAQLPAEQINKAGFRKEVYGGLNLHTQGFGASLYFTKFKTATVKTVYGIDFVKMKHSKEIKIFGAIDENAKGFVYGKLNSFYILRPGYGRRKIMYEKLREQAVEISYLWMIGPSIGMTKPEYLEVFNVLGEIPQIEKYDPEKHNLDNIYGRGPASRGWSELNFHPGIFGKIAINFEFSAYRSSIRGVEVGAVLDGYPWRIPIMTNTTNSFLYPTLYINLLLGKKYI